MLTTPMTLFSCDTLSLLSSQFLDTTITVSLPPPFLSHTDVDCAAWLNHTICLKWVQQLTQHGFHFSPSIAVLSSEAIDQPVILVHDGQIEILFTIELGAVSLTGLSCQRSVLSDQFAMIFRFYLFQSIVHPPKNTFVRVKRELFLYIRNISILYKIKSIGFVI